jgi:hypothetical protein
VTTIQPVSFLIPSDMQVGLASGDLIRYGGVVRNTAGQVVMHLKEAPLTERGQQAAQRILAELKNPVVVAGVGLGVVVLTGVTAFALWRRKRAHDLLAAYNASFAAYLEAARDRTLDEGVIGRLIADMDAVKESVDTGKIIIGFSTEQSEVLVNLVFDYTRQLAELNDIELEDAQAESTQDQRNTVIDLRRHLEVQRQIFARAA